MPSPLPPPGTEQPRRRRDLDWELVACAWSGHELVGRDAADVRPEDALVVVQGEGVRWHRCLRCDAWVALAAPTRPAVDHPRDRAQIEVPLRGRALRDRIVLRLIAIDRVLHFLVLGTLAVAIFVFAANRDSLRGEFYRVVAALQSGVGGGPIQVSGRAGIVHELDRLFTLSRGTLLAVGLGVAAYALMEGIEAVGLWYARRWAEYLTFVATTVLLPLEIYEIINRATVLKVVGFVINLAVVVWLLLRKRLFGLRGGGRADEALRAQEMSWARIERFTPAPSGQGAGPEARAAVGRSQDRGL